MVVDHLNTLARRERRCSSDSDRLRACAKASSDAVNMITTAAARRRIIAIPANASTATAAAQRCGTIVGP